MKNKLTNSGKLRNSTKGRRLQGSSLRVLLRVSRGHGRPGKKNERRLVTIGGMEA